MGWVKEANKLGKYLTTFLGYRIYVKVQPTHVESIITENGVQYRKTEFFPGEYVAVNRYADIIECEGLGNMIAKIEIEYLRQLNS